jgi:hypothetical protein
VEAADLKETSLATEATVEQQELQMEEGNVDTVVSLEDKIYSSMSDRTMPPTAKKADPRQCWVLA